MAEEKKESAAKAEKEEPVTYHRDRLVAEAQGIFDVPGYVVEAALSSGRASQKVNFTLDEVKREIKDFMDHEVEIDHPAAPEEPKEG